MNEKITEEEAFKAWVHKWFGKWSQEPAPSYYAYYRHLWDEARMWSPTLISLEYFPSWPAD